MSLRRHFVPTAWLLCGLPLSLSFHMNATLACNAIQSRKLNVPTLNSATLGSETELRSELGNASLARTAPSVEMSQVGQLFWAAARCQLARTSRENYCTGVSRARPPGASAIPVGTTDPVPQGDKKNKQKKVTKKWQQWIQVPSHTHVSRTQGMISRGNNGNTPGRMSRARGRKSGARSTKTDPRGRPVAAHS